MPKKAIDFSKSLIYKLCCKDTSITQAYVGSTTNFAQRKAIHKYSCNNENSCKYNYRVYQFIRDHGGWQNFNMVLIEYFPCENALELGRQEEHWRQQLSASLNSITPHIYENRQERYELFKQALTIKKPCECGLVYRHTNKSRHEKTTRHLKRLNLL